MQNSPEFSVIVPVYNRPEEVRELLESLTKQTFDDFEVLIIEDGSTNPCKAVVEGFADQLQVKYYFKQNSGQGFSRNYGFERARGYFMVVFDSDCLIPEDYFQAVHDHLRVNKLDAYGGPDRAHDSFTPLQKAINFSMTSILTTGGIRGGSKHLGQFHPRSFNMGITKEVFEKTGGYILPKKGEDIEFSIRIINSGFETGLIEKAFVFHKRRTSLRQFFRQLHFFGTARINVGRFFPGEVKLTHFFPSVFLLGLILGIALSLLMPMLGFPVLACYLLYFVLLVVDGLRQGYGIISFLGAITGFVQLLAYGSGFIQEGISFIGQKLISKGVE